MTTNEFVKEYYQRPINKTDEIFNDQINENKINEELRSKSIEFHYASADTIAIIWTSYGWNKHCEALVDEIIRCYQYLADQEKLDNDISIELVIQDYDRNNLLYYDKVVQGVRS